MSQRTNISSLSLVVVILFICALLITTRSFAVSEGFTELSGKSNPTQTKPATTTPTPTPSAVAQQTATPPPLEGCISCHGQIEPMHKYGTTETLDQLKDGKDAVGLTCTGCHGGNPLPRKTSDDPKSIQQIKNEAHVRAKFPSQWQRDGKYSGANPERTTTLLARESWEFIRFI